MCGARPTRALLGKPQRSCRLMGQTRNRARSRYSTPLKLSHQLRTLLRRVRPAVTETETHLSKTPASRRALLTIPSRCRNCHSRPRVLQSRSNRATTTTTSRVRGKAAPTTSWQFSKRTTGCFQMQPATGMAARTTGICPTVAFST